MNIGVWGLVLATALTLAAGSSPAHAQGGGLKYGQGATVKLKEDGSNYIRFISWLQMWTRVMQMNPGTTVTEDPSDVEADIALRRARFLAYGQITDDVLILLHMGINNQTFRTDLSGGFKPQLFFHDAWVEYKAIDRILYLGTGLHYWHGISRQTNASTLNFMALDAPITNWPLIEQADQFARQFGIFAKGKIFNLDYRISVNRPFKPQVGTPGADLAAFNTDANTWSTAGYVKWEFLDPEPNKLPYTVGSWLGTKEVFNIGAGYYYQPQLTRSIQTVNGAPVTELHDTFLFGADIFYDRPFGDVQKGGALTLLATLYYFDFGPNFLRNIGIANIGDLDSGTSVGGRGNGYPSIGTGTSVLLETGYLLPSSALAGLSLQPYFRGQLSFWDALNSNLAPQLEAGLNWFVIGHHAKLTLHYRARPVFVGDVGVETGSNEPVQDGFASEGILQAMIWF